MSHLGWVSPSRAVGSAFESQEGIQDFLLLGVTAFMLTVNNLSETSDSSSSHKTTNIRHCCDKSREGRAAFACQAFNAIRRVLGTLELISCAFRIGRKGDGLVTRPAVVPALECRCARRSK